MTDKEKNKVALILLIICLIVFALTMAWCSWRPPDTPTPTLAISETPSITPEPTTTPTPSATAVVPATVSPTGTGTAVITPTPPEIITAVPPAIATPEPTETETVQITPTATERPFYHVVALNEHLWGISEHYCGFPDWQWIYRENADQIRDPNLIRPGQRFVLPWPCK